MSFIKRDNGAEDNDPDSLEYTRVALAKTQALYRVAQSLIASSNLHELLQAVVDTVAETLPANRVTLVTFDVETRQISHFVKGGIGINDVVNVTFDELWDGLTGWTIRELQPALSSKLSPDIRESLDVQRRRQETNCGAIIVVPLQCQNTILGTLTAINLPEEREFTDDDVDLMMAMANQSAIAIENARLHNTLQLTNANLERRIVERTAALEEANAQLEQEIAERRQAEEERRAHLWFLQSMDQVNRAIQGANNLDQMMIDVLDAALTIFSCDRAWLVNPCDPESATWQVPMERSRPAYPGVLPLGTELPLEPAGAMVFRILRESSDPVQFGPETIYSVPVEMANVFSVKSFIAVAIYPKVGRPWAFGLHQCSYPHVWTSTEERLFQEIGRRLGDALTSLLAFRNLQMSERRLVDAQRIAHVGHWNWDAVHGVLEWSDETYRIFGLEPHTEPITLQRLKERIHPDDFETVFKAITDAEAGVKAYDIEYRIIHPDGAIRYIYNLGEVIFDGSKKPIGMFGTLIDVTERRQMEEVLRKSEKKYRSLIHKVHTAIVLHDEQGHILDSNPLAQQLLNLSEDQLIGKDLNAPVWHFQREDGSDMPVSEYPVSLVLSSQQPLRDYVVGIRQADQNEIIWALVNAEPEYDDGGELIHIITSFVEITERKRAEVTLRRQNEYFSTLYETTLAIMNRLNTEDLLNTILSRAVALVGTSYGSIFLFSSDKTELTAAIYTGYPKDLPLRHAKMGKGLSGTVWQTGKMLVVNDYQNWEKRSFGEIPDKIRANLGIPLKSKDELIGILCVDYHEEGRTFSDDDIAILVRFAALASIALDNAQLYNAVQQELEERKQAELTLQRYNKRLSILREIDHEILFASSPQSIATVVLKHLAELIPCEFLSVVLHNPQLTEERIFALRHTPDLGGVYTQEIQPVVQNQVLEKLKSGKTAIAPDLLQQAGPHAHLAEELESHGIRSALASPMIVQERLIGTIALAALEVGFFTHEHQQITEEVSAQIAIALHQAELNDQIAQYNAELEQRVKVRTVQLELANKELELFSYSVSHDLRAPLRAIQGFAEIIARRYKADLNDEGRHYFDNIVTASMQMDQLITDLLEYARLGRHPLIVNSVSLRDILDEVVENLRPHIEKSEGQISYSDNLPHVLGDRSLLRRVFTNLIENALIYHRVDVAPIITISCEIENNYAVVRVKDNGIGIDTEFREKIFDIFQRLHANDKYPGTGIGLAIVRKSIEILSGSIWVESSSGEGTVFCIKFNCNAEKETNRAVSGK
ncbi:MAG: GAF domain-containing protein [Anaerolineaceae bacterium]|nr:GAF domain-containing protein [Anaerolineaceae bacterium]